MHCIGALYLLLVVSFAALKCDADNSETAVQKFAGSSCGDLFRTADYIDRGHIESLLPTEDFWHFFANRSVSKSDMLLVDVDVHSVDLLLNQVVGLRKSGSKLADHVYAIAYDEHTCGKLISEGVNCYYSSIWSQQLGGLYQGQTRHAPKSLHVVMMGRMMTTAVALCEGHNVFLSDTDVVFYRDPIQYAFYQADIMITATQLNPAIIGWGDTYFPDMPGQVYTLNNGVVFYRSNPVMKNFVLTLIAHCVNSLKGAEDRETGFLQKVFNGMMVHNKLKFHPCSNISDPATFRLKSSHINNTVGECYDCYYGHFPWWSDVVQPVVAAGEHEVLKIGVYPIKRYTSYCWPAAGTLRQLSFSLSI